MLCCDTVPVLWLGLGTKHSWLGLGKDQVLAQNTWFCQHNAGWTCHDTNMSPQTWLERKSFFLKISSGVTLTKRSLKLQSLAWQPLPRYNSTTIPSTSTSQGMYCRNIYMVYYQAMWMSC